MKLEKNWLNIILFYEFINILKIDGKIEYIYINTSIKWWIESLWLSMCELILTKICQ